MGRYKQYCPVARAAEIFADRWTPLIIREMLAGSSHFNEIQRGLPGISRTLLSTRPRWAFGDPRPEELDPALLVWKIRGRIHHKRLPPRRVVVEFEFSGKRRSHVWLVLKREEASVCLKPPGFDTDLLVTADLGVFYCVWLGRLPYANAIRTGQVRLEGPTQLVREFPRWLRWSPMADNVRSALASA